MMFKKSLLSLAVASSVALTGCLDSGGDTSKNANPDYGDSITNPAREGRVFPVFNPVESDLPIPNDIIFGDDGTFDVQPDPTNPVITALNELSGASTAAPIDIKMSGKIDASSVNANPIALINGVPMPNPNQTVFLIELEYASGDPLQAVTTTREAPTVPAATKIGTLLAQMQAPDPAIAGAAAGELAAMQANPAYEASVIQLSGQDFIRINPLKPLNPNKRYLVVVTDGVKDANGNPILQSSAYETITGNGALGNDALADLRALMNTLWEPVAEQYFQLTNATRPAGAKLSDDNIALSYSFTTSNDEKVLSYIADPASWFAQTLGNSIRVKAAAAAVQGGASSYEAVKAVVDQQFNNFSVNALGNQALIDNCGAAPVGATQIGCAGTVLAANFASLLPTPKSRAVTFGTAKDATQVSAVLSNIVAPNEVSVVEGSMTLPYYLGTPSGTNGAPLVTGRWVADNNPTLVAGLTGAGFGAIPQVATPELTTVNQMFPFPKKQSDVEVPVLAMYSAGATLDNANIPVVIYQHGISTDRSAALTLGASLIANYPGPLAVIAIDLPLHGVKPVSTAQKLELATTLLSRGGLDPANAEAVVNGTFSVGALLQIDQLCPNITITNPADSTQITAARNTVLTGGCGPDAQANLGKALVLEGTVAKAGSTIPGLAPTDNERHFGFTANAASQPVAMNYDPENAVGVDGSGSLFINLTNFTGTRDNVRQGVLDLLNLRHSIAAMDVNGGGADFSPSQVYFVGHSLGAIAGTPFMAVANGSSTPADNILAANLIGATGGIVRTLENSPQIGTGKVLPGLAAAAGLQQGDADLETFFSVFQATVDSVDPINFADNLVAQNSKVLLSEIVGDNVIPSSAYPDALGNALPAPLAGTEALATALGAESITAAGTYPLTQAIIRYTGATHKTPILPGADAATEAEVFTAITGQTLSIIGSGGAAVVVSADDAEVVKQ